MQTKESPNGSVNQADFEEENDDLAPDGGWGWMVCFASFIANFILDGTMFSFGVLLLELLDYFGESKSKTSIVGSALTGTSMLMGPMVSLLLEKYSYRQVTIAGAILSTISFSVSIFSPNVEVLIITYGIMGGIGLSMMFITAVVVVGMYFTKKRAIATGIATSGSGIGIFVYSYMVEKLNETYDWRGTILIIAGLIANCAVCGAIFRPLISRRRYNLKYRHHSPPLDDASVFDSEVCEHDEGTTRQPYRAFDELHGYSTPQIGRKPMYRRLSRSHEYLTYETSNLSESRMYRSSIQITPLNQVKTPDTKKSNLYPLMKKDIYYSGSIMKLPEYKLYGDAGSFVNSLTKSDHPDDSRAEKSPVCSSLSKVFDFSLLKSNTFLFLLVMFILWTVQTIPLTYVPDLAVSRGISKEQAALIVSIIGGMNTLGRLSGGFIVDIFQVRSLIINTLALFVAAAVNFAIPFCSSFALFGVCAGIFGFCMACTVSLRTIILADVLGIEKLTVSFGVVALFQGVAFAVFPPIAGRLYDETLSYIPPFALAGTAYFVSGLASLVVLIRHRAKTVVPVTANIPLGDESSMHNSE